MYFAIKMHVCSQKAKTNHIQNKTKNNRKAETVEIICTLKTPALPYKSGVREFLNWKGLLER